MAENESSRGLESYKNLLKGDPASALPEDSGLIGTPQSTIDFSATDPGRRNREEILQPAGQPDEPAPEGNAEAE